MRGSESERERERESESEREEIQRENSRKEIISNTNLQFSGIDKSATLITLVSSGIL